MERAADDIRRALESDPANPTLQHLLLASYRRQVGLLHSVSRIPTRM
jgi:hypothetical protein